MIRRHAAGFRALLMATDALLAVAVLFGLSLARWGDDWAIWWRYIVPVPEALLVLYAMGWVIVLRVRACTGRARAGRSGARRSTSSGRRSSWRCVTLSVLFLFKLPDVSRLFLLAPVPGRRRRSRSRRASRSASRSSGCACAAATPATSSSLGAGPRGQAFAAKLESHRELGLRIAGFLDDRPVRACRAPWPRLGRLDDLETRPPRRGSSTRSRSACRSAQWDLIDAIARPVRGGGQDRPDPDRRAGPRDLARAASRSSTARRSSRSCRARTARSALAVKRVVRRRRRRRSASSCSQPAPRR